MSGIEESFVRRASGRRIFLGSLALGVGGAMPLLLYSVFGPADGNPIGLGLLAVLAVPVGAIGAGFGLIVMLAEHVSRGRRQ